MKGKEGETMAQLKHTEICASCHLVGALTGIAGSPWKEPGFFYSLISTWYCFHPKGSENKRPSGQKSKWIPEGWENAKQGVSRNWILEQCLRHPGQGTGIRVLERATVKPRDRSTGVSDARGSMCTVTKLCPTLCVLSPFQG